MGSFVYTEFQKEIDAMSEVHPLHELGNMLLDNLWSVLRKEIPSESFLVIMDQVNALLSLERASTRLHTLQDAEDRKKDDRIDEPLD